LSNKPDVQGGDFRTFTLPDTNDWVLYIQKKEIEPTLTATETETPVKTPTLTPTPVKTATETATPVKDCLRITSPGEFLFNTILLSWTPIENAYNYEVTLYIKDSPFKFDIDEHFVKIIAKDNHEWKAFVQLGELLFSVAAKNEMGNIIEGPTEINSFICNSIPAGNHANSSKGAEPGCLYISSPKYFSFNTILLSWTPIIGADGYKFEYKYSDTIFEAVLVEHYLRLIIPDLIAWEALKNAGRIEYRVSALNLNHDVIDQTIGWDCLNVIKL